MNYLGQVMTYKTLVVLMLTAMLMACSVMEENKPNVDYLMLLNDSVFPEHTKFEIESSAEIYAIDREMKAYAYNVLLKEPDPYRRSKLLLNNIFHRSDESIRYESGANLTAIQAYHKNTANCLSLTILAYALAEEGRLDVNFQEVFIPEYWIRQGSFSMLTGHVNLKVLGHQKEPNHIVMARKETIIDFDPYSVKKHFPTKTISKDRVTAMFYNNKGAQALVRQEYNKAYAYFKAGILQEPNFSPVWGNLGLLYKKIGMPKYAEQTYLASVNYNLKNYNAWNNLAILLSEQMRMDEVRKIQSYILKARLENPYYHGLLGDEAFYQGNYLSSIKHYKRAKRMMPKEHEFYFGLARSFYKLGDKKSSQYYLNKAKKNARFKDVEEKYNNKLNLFTSLQR